MSQLQKSDMKKISLIFLSLMSVSNIYAINLGSLDQSFSNDGVTDGWDIQGSAELGLEYYGGDVIVDSQGRILVAGTFEFELSSGIEDKAAQLLRYLPSGEIDSTFGTDGQVLMIIPPAPIDQFSYELALDGADGVFVGYSRLFCPTSNDAECHSDIRVNHINANGTIVDALTIPFDAGSTFQRQDDVFADLIYIETLNKVAIAAEVERTGSDDTDFGVLMLNNNPSNGTLSIDTTFDSDGKNLCFFDQNNPAGSRDKAEALVWDAVNNTVIVGGSAFEGDGVEGDGWNMAFCEFNLSGALLRKWSTQVSGVVIDSREFLSDMAFTVDDSGTQQLLVTGSLPGAGGLDYALTRYNRNILGEMVMDSSFGPNGTGWSSVGFSYFAVGDTRDTAAEIYIENDGSILLAGTIGNPNQNGVFQSAVAMAMFDKTGDLDTTWGIGRSGKAVHTFNTISFWDAAFGVTENPQTEEIYIAGFSYNGNFNLLLANFHNDRIFADNFE